MTRGGLLFLDDEGNEVVLDAGEAEALLAAADRLEPATVSACPDCASRVVASVALVDLLDDAAPHTRSSDLVELADEAPTLHLYVVEVESSCRHEAWRDPGFGEWFEVVEGSAPRPRA